MSSDELKDYRGQVYAWKERDTAIIERLEARNAKLVAALESIIAVYNYCSADEADRGWAPLDNEIQNALELLTPTPH